MSDEIETPLYVVFTHRDVLNDRIKESLSGKVEYMRAKCERANDKRNLKYSLLLETVQNINAQDNSNIEKFIENVESILKLFSNELTPLENIYRSIMNRLSES